MIGPDPVDTLRQMAAGFWVPRCLHSVANLGVADALGDTPQSAAALAEATGADGAALDRVLRFLSAYGVFEHRNGLIAHTPASRRLRADHPHSMRSLVRMFALPVFWNAVGELEHSIRTGLPGTDKAAPGGFWGYLSANPEASRIFDEAMTGKAQAQVAAIVAAYDFSRFGAIADIGGGRGHLLQAVLSRAPQASGVLFDQAHHSAGLGNCVGTPAAAGRRLLQRRSPGLRRLSADEAHSRLGRGGINRDSQGRPARGSRSRHRAPHRSHSSGRRRTELAQDPGHGHADDRGPPADAGRVLGASQPMRVRDDSGDRHSRRHFDHRGGLRVKRATSYSAASVDSRLRRRRRPARRVMAVARCGNDRANRKAVAAV